MSPSRTLLSAAVCCFLVALVVPTAAISLQPDETTHGVSLESTSLYATVEDDELRLDLEKLNERATTTVDDVFAITISDESIDQLWVENNIDGLEFHKTGDPTSEISESSPLEPSAGQTVGIGIAIDTAVVQSETETFTVHVTYEDEDSDDDDDGVDDSEPTLESVSVEPTTVQPGETITVEATYHNPGTESVQTTADLTVDGTVVDSRTVEIGPGETRTVAFERQMQWPGSYDVGIDGGTTADVTVAKSDDGNETEDDPVPTVTEATVDATELAAGERATVEATVSNPTDERVQRTLEFAVDGIVVETRAIALEPGSERTVSFERQFDAAGTYDLAVSGVDAGTITVSDSDAESPLVWNRELSAATTVALAPPLAGSLLALGTVANRRWQFLPGR